VAPRARAAPALRPKERPPVSRVLLVGAPTRAPGFRSFVRNLTGLDPEAGGVDPDAAVALGAAVQAAALDDTDTPPAAVGSDEDAEAGGARHKAGGGQRRAQRAQRGRGGLIVLDVLQGALARALAAKALEQDEALADRVMGRAAGGFGGGRRGVARRGGAAQAGQEEDEEAGGERDPEGRREA
jgi:hypothetical protein